MTRDTDKLRFPLWTILVWIVGGVALFGFCWMVAFFSTHRFVEPYAQGYLYNAINGQYTVLERTGWIEHEFFTEDVRSIDMRPKQVCITGTGSDSTINSRVLNCKLVRFNPAGLLLFLGMHGRVEGDVSDYLRIYAYEGRGADYPFLTVIRELQNVDVNPSAEFTPGAEEPIEPVTP